MHPSGIVVEMWRAAAAIVAGVVLAATTAVAGQAPNVVLLSVDTLRADRIGVYGSNLATPHMDRIGREGAIATTAFAPTGRTTQSVGTIITGLHPFQHGADTLTAPLAADVTTLAERFRAAGYQTAAFMSNVNLAPGRGFEQGFDVFRNPGRRWSGNSAPELTGEVDAWLDGERTSAPLFLWVHYLDPHWAYDPEPQWAQRTDPEWTGPFDLWDRLERKELSKGDLNYDAPRLLPPRTLDHLKRLYDAEVISTDAAIEVLLRSFDRHGLLAGDTILVFTADHGESLGEHGLWFAHGDYLYDETLRVPLMFRAPGRIPAGTTIAGLTNLADVVPSVLDLAGQPAPAPVGNGLDFAPMLRAGGAQRLKARTAVHYTDPALLPGTSPRNRIAGRGGEWLAIRKGAWKFIRIPNAQGAGSFELYHLRSDPDERRNLSASAPRTLARFQALLDRELAKLGRASEPVPTAAPTADPGRDDRLRQLGYIQ